MSADSDDATNSRPPRPNPLSVDFEAIAPELKARDTWLLWKYNYDHDRGEWTKVPVNPHTGGFGSSTDPDSWATFDRVREAHESDVIKSDGIGFVFDQSDTVVGVDIDDARDTENGRPNDLAKDVINTLDSWTEVSPSGTGYHVYVFGILPSDARNRKGKLEIYQEGRFFTVTGQHVDGTPDNVNTRNDKLQVFHTEHVADDESDENNSANDSVSPSEPVDLSDKELVEKAKNADDGGKFKRLWEGNTSTYPSHSEARLALLNRLAFWTGKDRGRMRRLFEQSALAQQKPEKSMRDFDNYAADKAIRDTSDTYDPKGLTGQNPVVESGEADFPRPSAFDVHNGGYAKYHPPRDDDGDGYYERITNFQIETLSRLTHDDGTREYHLRIHPTDGESYEVTCEPVVFNDSRRFQREVLDGWTATFDGSQDDLNRLKEFVGTQPAKNRTGTKLLGWHGDEWVTPDGSLTAEGWSDDPETVFTDVETPLATAFNLKPSDGAEYDRETVKEILRLLPQTRNNERFLPVVGWFYAAPFRPFIQQREGEFNLLNILGDTGSGKTTTLQTLWRLFGIDEELPEAKATPFSIMRMIASSNAIPVILDEYKPAEIRDYKLDELHSNLRASTRGGVVTKGRADMGVDRHRLNAPICISGEQPIQGPAEERRTILTVFKRDVAVGQTPEQDAYARLAGGEANGAWYDGYDLTEHATAYYRWVLGQDRNELADLWEQSRAHVMDLLEGMETSGVDDLVIQGLQTIKFGCTLYRAFGNEMGLSTDANPVTPEAIDKAIEYVATSGTGAEHTSHLDRLLGLLTRAASAGYVQGGKHFKVVREGKPNAELRIHLPTAFDQVRRYARDHDVRGDDLLGSAQDYRARIKDAADDPESYVTTHSQYTPNLNQCVGIHITDAVELVDGFEPEAFDAGDSDEQTSDRLNPVSIHEIATDPTGYPTVEGEIATIDYPEGENAPAVKATLVDGKSAIDVISWDDSNAVEHGEKVIIENADTSTFDGEIQLVVKPGVTTVHEAPEDGQRQIDEGDV